MLALAVIGLLLFVGVVAYRNLEHLSWEDSVLNASMLLSGMGPAHLPKTFGGKMFASCYALFSGIVVLCAGLAIAGPIYHRLMHKLHLESDPQEKPPAAESSPRT